jgi:uncharacterized protein (DUF4213/DUF364 family)
MTDPLAHFYSKFGFDRSKIKTIASGNKYVGVMLKNGRIGVCSTLQAPIDASRLEFDQPDLAERAHRIIYNAYLNALLNYEVVYEAQEDIFNHLHFHGQDRVVMIGFFRPLVTKFKASGIPLTVFDHHEDNKILTPIHQIDEALHGARQVILTSTSLANGTFHRIVQEASESSDIYLLGPSSILHHDLFEYRRVKKVYGSVFDPFDRRVLDVISAGHGTQSFQKYGQKVNI